MKKGGLLHPAICSLLAELGHEDELLIVDAGYPVPPDAHVVIDLTVTPGIPSFLDVFRPIAAELIIDSVTVPAEMPTENEVLYEKMVSLIGNVEVVTEPYHEFRDQSLDVKGVIRTAEFTPYASVRIFCGSPF